MRALLKYTSLLPSSPLGLYSLQCYLKFYFCWRKPLQEILKLFLKFFNKKTISIKLTCTKLEGKGGSGRCARYKLCDDLKSRQFSAFLFHKWLASLCLYLGQSTYLLTDPAEYF